MPEKLKNYRLLEFLTLFVGMPVLLIFTEDLFPLIPTLLILMGVAIVLLRITGWQYTELWRGAPLSVWRNALLLWLCVAVLSIAVVHQVQPERLFSFAKSNTQVWLLVMLLYPLVSALPQELFYRTLFWYRYRELFHSQKWSLIIASGVLFMWAHVLFINWFAFTVTLLGGLLFAWRYYHTKSLLLVTVEHGLYGNLLFTVGLGQYLFSGAV